MASPSIRVKAEQHLRNLLWNRSPLCWKLRSGLEVTVANEAEWILYGDIFVDREYDLAIARALERTQGASLSACSIWAPMLVFSPCGS